MCKKNSLGYEIRAVATGGLGWRQPPQNFGVQKRELKDNPMLYAPPPDLKS